MQAFLVIHQVSMNEPFIVMIFTNKAGTYTFSGLRDYFNVPNNAPSRHEPDLATMFNDYN